MLLISAFCSYFDMASTERKVVLRSRGFLQKKNLTIELIL